MRRLIIGLLAALCATLALAGSGYTVGGTDLDSYFAPYHAGWPQAGATGYKVGGTQDLNARYAPLSTGATAGITGYKVGGATDLNAIFAAYGSTGLVISTQPSAVSGTMAAGNPSGGVTSNSTSCAATHGNSGAYSYSWHIASGAASPTASTSSSSAVTGTVNAGTTSSGTWYCTISDGVTSANTSAVGWSLTNTTPATITVDFSVIPATFSIGGFTYIGYYAGASGSLSITSGALPAGTSFHVIDTSSTSSGLALNISGFSADPGVGWFNSLTMNSLVLTSATAGFAYSYSFGVASFSWSTATSVSFGSPQPFVLVYTP